MKRKRLEGSVQGAVISWAKAHGIRCDKLSSGSHFQSSGLPDFIVWIPGGRPLLIEFKREGGVPTTLQTATHTQLRALGYDVHVIDDVVKGKQLIKERYENAPGK